jgi:hypothetical protein
VTTYTREQITTALNRAADEIAEAVGINEGPILDAMNLAVNVGMSYLEGTADTVADAIEENYDVLSDDIEEGRTLVDHVLGWLE